MSDRIDKNLTFTDVLNVLEAGLLPSGSAIMDGDLQVWPEQEVDVDFYPDDEDEELDD